MKPFGRLPNAFKMLREMYDTQLNASVPPALAGEFADTVYHANLPRFATLSAIVAIVDITSLVVYLIYNFQTGGASTAFFWVQIAKIMLMVSLFFFLLFRQQRPYKRQHFLDRNIDILFPIVYAVSEFFLFADGPQKLGTLIRFCAVPFIIGAVSIMKQNRSIVLQSSIFVVFNFYLLVFTMYGEYARYAFYFLNIGITFICSMVISSMIYSAFVNDFVHDRGEQAALEELNRANARLDILSRRDQLTGLSNRRDFDQFMEMSWPSEQQRGGIVSIIMIDIDHFKAFNDRFGHVAGDSCLVKVTKAVSDCLHNEGYLFARYGGEEFVVVAFAEEHADMVKLAERIRSQVEALGIENPDSSATPYLTISLGVATRNMQELLGHDTIVNIADECLYYAKAAGRNRLVHVDPASNVFRNIENRPLRPEISEENTAPGLHDSAQLRQAFKGFNLDCTFVYSRKHGILEFSNFSQELLGMPHSIATPSLEKVMENIPMASEDIPNVAAQLRRAFDEQKRAVETEARLVAPDGHKNWVAIRLKCLYTADGQLEIASGSFFSIQNVLDYSNYAHEQAMLDTLTQLPNRKKFHADMRVVLGHPGSAGYVVLFDINSFKSINGIFSHAIGDRTLKKVGTLMRRITGDKGQVYHYTVDKFVVLLAGCSEAEVRFLTERVQQFFATYGATVKGISLKIAFNVGAVAYTGGQDDLDDLMLNLDIALQKAKLEHKQNFRLFTAEDKVEYMQSVQLEKELAEAVRTGFKGFALHYQPLFSQVSDSCLGAEALLRWQRRSGEDISPLTVVPVLENSGLIITAGYWILDTACRQCRAWIDEGAREDFYVHVNLSALQIDDGAFVDTVFDVLEKNRLKPKNLVLEITESSFLVETAQSIGVLNALRSSGIRIAVDDFGTGYSSLSYLRSLPADVIKIDKSFLADVADDGAARRILHSVADLTRSMGYKVCVEGVETEEQMSFLKESFVDLLQGFLLGRPVPADSFSQQWLASEGAPQMAQKAATG